MLPHFINRSIIFRDAANPLIQPMKIPKGHDSDFEEEDIKQQSNKQLFAQWYVCSKNHPPWLPFTLTSYHQSTEPVTAQCQKDELTQMK